MGSPVTRLILVRMTRLLLAACLFGAICISLTGGEEAKAEGTLELVHSKLIGRVVRDAAPKKKKNNKKKAQKKKGKKSAKRKQRKGRKAGKKGLKKRAKKNNGGKKKRKKGTKGKKVKNGKRKGRKRGRKSRKKGNKNRKKRKAKKTNRQSECLTKECLETSIKYQTKLKDKVGNFLKQKERIEKYIKVTNNKGAAEKTSAFSKVVKRLRTSGGGNSSALSCQGSSTSPAAKGLTVLVNDMNKCKDEITTRCVKELPAYNATTAADCVAAMDNFTESLDKCGADCTCLQGADLKAEFELIVPCDLVETNKLITEHKNKCTKEFSACKKLEDAAGQAIASCEAKPKEIKSQLGALNDTIQQVEALAEKIEGLIVDGADVRSTQLTCSDFVTAVQELEEDLLEDPSNKETLAAVTDLVNSTVAV